LPPKQLAGHFQCKRLLRRVAGRIGCNAVAQQFMARRVLGIGPMNQQEQTSENLTDEHPELEHDVVAFANQARETVEEFAHEQPHAALAIAAAAGFILGGGLTPRRLFRLGLAAGGPVLSRQIRDELMRFASEALRGGERSEETKRAPARRRRTKAESS
jgi:hypothetical protein